MPGSASVVEQVRRAPYPPAFTSNVLASVAYADMALGPPTCLQAQAARAAAVAEVQRLLASADDLKRLSALREDVAAKQQVGCPLVQVQPYRWLVRRCCPLRVMWGTVVNLLLAAVTAKRLSASHTFLRPTRRS